MLKEGCMCVGVVLSVSFSRHAYCDPYIHLPLFQEMNENYVFRDVAADM